MRYDVSDKDIFYVSRHPDGIVVEVYRTLTVEQAEHLVKTVNKILADNYERAAT